MASNDDIKMLAGFVQRLRTELLRTWQVELIEQVGRRQLMSEAELRDQSGEFLRQFAQALGQAEGTGITGAEWAPLRELLAELSASRALQGFSPAETARFVLSFKRPLLEALRREITDARQLTEVIWTATELLDNLALHTTEVYQKSREEVIVRQQEEMLELSTPVVKLWDGILALPLIGTLDSNRTQVVMESLLQRIVDTNSEVAIIDITGVPTVDTLVAQHLMKTVAAARLMGVECIISGIRPQIAQTIVHLGVALGDIVTKATLADAFRLALSRIGTSIQNSRSHAR